MKKNKEKKTCTLAQYRLLCCKTGLKISTVLQPHAADPRRSMGCSAFALCSLSENGGLNTNTIYLQLELPEAGSQGVTKRCRRSLLTSSALVYEPKCGGEGGVAGSEAMSTGAQINFRDLTTYLTYARS